MNESKECHANNNDILSNCLDLMKSSVHKQRLQSSHSNAYYVNRNRVEDKKMAIISAEVDSAAYFDELLAGGH